MKFILDKDNLTVENSIKPKSGSVNYYEMDVEYDDSWNGLTIVAVMVPSRKNVEEIGTHVAVIDNKFFIDKKLSGVYAVGFIGYTIENDEKIYQISSNLVNVRFVKGAGEIETEEEDLPTPTQWEIYIAQIQAMLDDFSGVPDGGTTGQALVKKSNQDGDVEWKTIQGGDVDVDNYTINRNSQNKIQTIGVIDTNTGNSDKFWVGTLQEYNAIQNKDSDTFYCITDDDTQITDVLVNNVSVVENGIANITMPTSLSNLTDDSTHRTVTDTEKSTWNNKSDFSGSYNDLTNKPTIPPEVTENTVSGWGFTKNEGTITSVKMNGSTISSSGEADLGTIITDVSGKQDVIDSSHKLSADLIEDGSTNKTVTATEKSNWDAKRTYSKPSGGIPSSDLSSAVQTSLGKADTALQSETYTGTITGITMNGTSKGTSGVVDLGTVITDISGKQDVIDSSHKLSADLVDDTSTTNKFVTASDKTNWNAKQDKIQVVTSAQTTLSINPNTYYSFGEVVNLNITLTTPTDNTVYNEYMFEFDSGSTATTLTLPNTVEWLETPTIEANKTYQCSIVNNIGVLLGV